MRDLAGISGPLGAARCRWTILAVAVLFAAATAAGAEPRQAVDRVATTPTRADATGADNGHANASTTTGIAATGSVAAKAAGSSVDYLVIASNEGSSSGGHVALRIGDQAYDFQRHDSGFLRIGRRDADELLYDYTCLQNRPVRDLRLAVGDDTRELLRERFNTLYLSQQARFDALGVLAEDTRLLRAFADPQGKGRAETIEVPGAGYFFATPSHAATRAGDTSDADATTGQPHTPPAAGAAQAGARSGLRPATSPAQAGAPAGRSPAVDVAQAATSAGPSPSSPALVALRERVERELGEGWIAGRLAASRRSVEAMEPNVLAPGDLPADEASWPHVEGAFSRRYRDTRTAIVALAVLDAAAAPLRERTIAARGPEFALDAAEVAALRRYEARLSREAVALVQTPGDDWGFAMLVAMARLAAIDESVRSGRLVVLDAFPADAKVLGHDDVVASVALDHLVADSRRDFDAARAAMTPDIDGEAAYAWIESATNRFHEIHEAATAGGDLRVVNDRLAPDRPARFALDLAPRGDAASFAALATKAATLEAAWEKSLRRAHAYDLLRRNCVTEIFHTAAAAMGNDPAVSTARLGGWIEPGSAGTIVPFVSAGVVERTWRIAASRDIASWRQQRLAAMEGDAPLAVALREGNTLTSTIYPPNPADSTFLLFADPVAARPFAGLVNLATGAGAAAAGLVTLPVRGSGPLRQALRGMMFSVPELFFVEIRRGNFVYVSRRDAAPPAWW